MKKFFKDFRFSVLFCLCTILCFVFFVIIQMDGKTPDPYLATDVERFLVLYGYMMGLLFVSSLSSLASFFIEISSYSKSKRFICNHSSKKEDENR